MKYLATLTTQSASAKSIADALNVDNYCGSKLNVRTKCVNGELRTVVEAEKLNTLCATLDDLIHCQMTAEKMVS